MVPGNIHELKLQIFKYNLYDYYQITYSLQPIHIYNSCLADSDIKLYSDKNGTKVQRTY